MKALQSRARRPRFAEVTSVLALFVALGGTGYAAARLPSDSVGASQIRTGAVGASEVRSGAIGRSELRSGSTGKSEIRSSAVGSSEIATDAVGASEIRRDAIDTTELRDAGVELADLSPAVRGALTDAVTFRAAVTSTGADAGGNAKGASRSAPGEYAVDLGRDVSACQLAATLAGVRNASTVEQPEPGFITAVAEPGHTTVRVSVKDTAGVPSDAPFHLLVAC